MECIVKRQTTIQSSKLRVASIHIMWICFGLIWPMLYIFAIHPAEHIGAVFKALFALCALASGAVAISEVRRTWRVFTTSGDWKATIAGGRLRWDAAIPSEALPLDVALHDIEKALRMETSRTVRDGDGEHNETSERFELHFTNGRLLTFDRATTGVSPHRVFLALARHGARYEYWSQDLTRGSSDTSEVFHRPY